MGLPPQTRMNLFIQENLQTVTAELPPVCYNKLEMKPIAIKPEISLNY